LVTVTTGSAVYPVGTTISVTATVSPIEAGVDVAFQVFGSSANDYHCTTSSLGKCSITYLGPILPGADAITACVDGPLCDVTTVAWILPPASTPGQTAGGGQLVPPGPSPDEVGFAFVANSQNGVPKGTCRLVDPNVDIQVKCLDVWVLTLTGSNATFYGSAEVNGAAATYQIDVSDGGEGKGSIDTFALVTSNGYAVAGTVLRGNVQVRM
jgi:hypothetical protein